MIYQKFSISFIIVALLLIFCNSCNEINKDKQANFLIGWANSDITPPEPFILRGGRTARISKGIMDPVTATAMALESVDGLSSEKTILISCDLITIHDHLRDLVRKLLQESIPEIDPNNVILMATHTHSAPYHAPNWWRVDIPAVHTIEEGWGIELDALSPAVCFEHLSKRIATVAKHAWDKRKAGGISFGLGHAVVGHNRLGVDRNGKSHMYGNVARPEFSHIEGFEDHSVNLLYTWNKSSKLTGVVINIAAPSQVSEGSMYMTADYWHNVREEIQSRLGSDIYILPQCSAAGDQSPHLMIETRAEQRMQELMFPGVETGRGSPGRRKQIAVRIANAVTSVLPYVKNNIEWVPLFIHKMEIVDIPRRVIGIEDVQKALEESKEWEQKYREMLNEINENPGIKEKPGWYRDVTKCYSFMKYGQSVRDRFELQKKHPQLQVEVHVIRIGDIVMATNPFELYLDYGIRIKARSPAIQTFIVQLAGDGSYVPTKRVIEGGGYGAVSTSTLIGPEGGEVLVKKTLEMINIVMQ